MWFIDCTKIILFVLAYLIVALVMIYGVNLPAKITQNEALVNEYYFVEPAKSLALDLVFIVFYYLFAMVLWEWFQVTSVYAQGGIFIASTAFLTAMFWFVFTRRPLDQSSSFFTRWFHGVGVRSVAYDVILLGLIFVVYHGLQRAAVKGST